MLGLVLNWEQVRSLKCTDARIFNAHNRITLDEHLTAGDAENLPPLAVDIFRTKRCDFPCLGNEIALSNPRVVRERVIHGR